MKITTSVLALALSLSACSSTPLFREAQTKDELATTERMAKGTSTRGLLGTILYRPGTKRTTPTETNLGW